MGRPLLHLQPTLRQVHPRRRWPSRWHELALSTVLARQIAVSRVERHQARQRGKRPMPTRP